MQKKDIRLVKALLDLVDKDEKIGTETKFYIQEDGSKIKKAKLHHFCFVYRIFLQILLFAFVFVEKTNNFSYDDAKFFGKKEDFL